MIRVRVFLSGAICATVLLIGCGTPERKAEPTSANSAGKDDMAGMAGMPGMTTSDTKADSARAEGTVVTFTAAQLQHGGVQWGPVTTGTASGSATVPGGSAAT